MLEGDPRLSKLEGFVTEWDKDGRPLKMVPGVRGRKAGGASVDKVEVAAAERKEAPPPKDSNSEKVQGDERRRTESERTDKVQRRRQEQWELDGYDSPESAMANGGVARVSETMSEKPVSTKRTQGKKVSTPAKDGEHGGGCRCVIM
jgi:hypothetical protein